MDVAYFRLWWGNIGNAFIDIGALYLLKKVFQGRDVYTLSGFHMDVLSFRMMKKSSWVRRIYRKFPSLVEPYLKGLA